MRPAHKAICVLLAGIALYDWLCADGETISEGVDALLEQHPLATELVALTLYLHVANKIPDDRADPIHWLFLAARWSRKHFGATRRG